MSPTSNLVPNPALASADQMREWVLLCLQHRKNGADPQDVARLGRTLARLLPAVAQALSAADPADAKAGDLAGDGFEAELLAQSRG